MFTPSSPLHVVRFLSLNRKTVFLALSLVSLTAGIWFRLQPVQSAPGTIASPAAVPLPNVTITPSGNALIGSKVKFIVTFDNSAIGSTVGYGPFIDLVFDAGGANVKLMKGGSCACDGLTFDSATLLGVKGGPTQLIPIPPTAVTTAPCDGSSNSGPTLVAHPFALSGVPAVLVPPGGQLVTLALPFGSFDPTQPRIEIEVSANLSNLADVGTTLTTYARGGFRYGASAVDNVSPILTDTNSNAALWFRQAQVTPSLINVTKTYRGPEGENATGPNFIGFYPLKYDLTIDVAPGQTIQNVVLKDCLPNNMAYDGLDPLPAGATLNAQPPIGQSSPCLEVGWISLTGSVTVSFNFHIPENDANGASVLPLNCTAQPSINTVQVTFDWVPIDPCDTALNQFTPPPVTDTLMDKCIAIQKSVDLATDIGYPGLTPGDVIKYTLKFQISDFKTFRDLEVVDRFTDGQSLLGTPTLTVTDQFGTTSGAFTSGVDMIETTSTYPAKQCGVVKAVNLLAFKVSPRMMTAATALNPRHLAGVLTGGFASNAKPTKGATGLIEFFTKIDDEFKFTQPGDKYLDKEDPINNCVDINGTVLSNQNPETPVPANVEATAHDDSSTALALVGDTLKKTVYAVQRAGQFVCAEPPIVSLNGACSNFPQPPQEVRPGDDVTFRFDKKIPSTDAEQLVIDDWLPLPIFKVAGFTASSLAACAPTTVPAANSACYHSSDTMHLLFSTKPTFIPLVASNSLTFDYDDIFDPNNAQRNIDILFTSRVTNDPFADQLFLTNEVRECENNTFGRRFCQVAIAQVNLREPKLKIRKGIIATDNANGVFAPALNPAGVWKPYGASCPAFNGTINSANIAGLVNSNLNNVDASDSVTFAISIENTGGAPAFEIELADIIPLDALDQLSCFSPDLSHLCITDGSGAPIAFTTSPGGHGRTIIKFAPGFSLAAGSPTNTTGTNIAIITFNAQLLDQDHLKPGCCDNTAQLLHYTSQTGGPDFVAGGFTPPFTDAATVCFLPTLEKSIVATSESHTSPQTAPPGTPPVVIGEIVRYRLVVRLPEGIDPNFQINDSLPSGMSFLNDGTARLTFISNGGISTTPVITTLPVLPASAISGGTGCGVPVTFSLGDVKNNDSDPDLEYVELEFNALVCNVIGNQDGTTLSNTFSVSVDNKTIASSPAINVIVREPKLTIKKVASPTTVVQGVTATYTVIITNGPVTAFDTSFADTLPAGLILDPASVSFGGNCSSPVLVNTVPSLTCTQIPANGQVTLTYKALARPDTCPVTLTNNATIRWTSLPGPQGTTVNSTMSSTPAASGLQLGERDGSGSGPNDYIDNAPAPIRVLCPPCTTAPANMVAWWPFDEPNGSTVDNDIAAFNNQGKPTPGTSLGAVNAPGSVTGLVGLAVNIPAKTGMTGPHIEVPDHAELNFGFGDLSIDSWVFVPQTAPPAINTFPIVDKLQTGPAFAQFLGYALYLVTSGSNSRLVFEMGDGLGFGSYSDPANVVPSGQWTHIAVTVKRSTKTVTFFVNGNSAATIDPAMPTGSLANTLPLFIGEIRAKNSQAAITIDELEMFDRAISPSEVQNIYKAFSGGKCKCPTIVFSPAGGALPPGVVNIPYTQTFTATGGCSSSFTYNVVSGALPPGLTLSSSGVLSGTPKQPGVYTFTITATDACGCSRSQTYTLTVDCPMVPLPLFNTGVADDGSLLASGVTDPHYVLQIGSAFSPTATVVPLSQRPPAWLPNNSASQWIGPDITPLSTSPTGDYIYRVTFNMPAGADLSTAIIAGRWASDNGATIFLNGFLKQTLGGPTPFVTFTSFSITGNFQHGPNNLDFVVHNAEAWTGLRVEMNGSVRCCPPPKADKCVITTSESHTIPSNSTGGTPQVAIGEIIRYRLTATLTEGVSPSFRFTDHLPPGLTYLGNPTVAFVSTGGAGSISSSVPGVSNLTASNVSACSGPTPTFVLPSSQVTGGPFNSGTDPTFNLGNLTNSHSDPNLEYVILEFNALVNNLPVNAPGSPNQNGATLSNFYDVFVGNGTTPIATSAPTDVVIVEPHLVVQKTVTTDPLTNQPTFTLTLESTGTATAFDVELNDVLPGGVAFTSTAPAFSSSPAGCSLPAVNVTGSALTMTVPAMPVGCKVTLTFKVVVSAECIAEPNVAHVTYTSLPGGNNSTPVGTQSNNTGSVTPGPTGADNGDRLYTASAQAPIPGGGVGSPCKPSCKCPLKISRFRENGPNGVGDEFVEIFNTGDFDVSVSECSNDPAGKSNGIGVFASAGNGFNPIFGQAANVAQLVCQIPGATVIPARGYFLCGGQKYTLGSLGKNGGTLDSKPDQTIGAGNAMLTDIPNDAGLALLDLGSNIATQCALGVIQCCSGFKYSGPAGTGDAVVYDSVGFAAYGPGSPLNVGPGLYPANIYPSLAHQYCEGACLQPVGDASVVPKGPGVPCLPVSPAPGIIFPSQPGGTIGATSICYGESGQYEILRRQTIVDLNVGTLHRDTGNNPDDFILVAPNPATNTVGQTITGKGVTSVLGAAGPYNLSAPHDISFNSFPKSQLLPNITILAPDPGVANIENAPLKTVTLRLIITNSSGQPISGVRFKVDDLATLCGRQTAIPNSASSILGNADARNLSASPTCTSLLSTSAILKAVNSQSTPGVLTPSDGVQTFLGTVLEDLSQGPLVGALSPFGGGVDSSFVVIDSTALNPIGDGVTGGKGTYNLPAPIPPGGKLFVQFKFGVVKNGAVHVIFQPMGR